MWEFFELTEGAINEKKFKKAICKLCEGVSLAYGGGTGNLLNHLEAKHPVVYKKAVPGETCAPQRQATLSTFRKTCPPARVNHYSFNIRSLRHPDIRIHKTKIRCSPRIYRQHLKEASCAQVTIG